MFGKKNKPPKKAVKSNDFVLITIKTHKDSKGGHPHGIIDNVEDKHVSVGFTHDRHKGKGKKSGNNYALECNPLGGDKQSYMRRQATVAQKSEYEHPRKGKMSKKDYEQAKQYSDKAKQKYLDGKKGKKK